MSTNRVSLCGIALNAHFSYSKRTSTVRKIGLRLFITVRSQ